MRRPSATGLRWSLAVRCWRYGRPDMHKGLAVRAAVAEIDARGVLFVGDDLGDLEAFDAVRELRDQGMPGLLVCSGSTEQNALEDAADVVVAGPDGVIALLERLSEDLGFRPGSR